MWISWEPTTYNSCLKLGAVLWDLTLTCGVCANWVVRVRTELDCIKLLITNVRRELEKCLVWETHTFGVEDVMNGETIFL